MSQPAGGGRPRGRPASHDLTDPELRRAVERMCACVDIAPEQVDLERIHALTAQVSLRVARPMAPVSAMVLGFALGRGMDADTAVGLLEGVLPE